MTTLRPYPEYKASDIEWLGDVPSHWNESRGKALFTKMDRPVPDFSETVTCFRDGMVTLRRSRRTTGFTEALQEIGYQGVCSGDLVIHAMDAFAGAVGVSDSDGKCSPVYSVCTPIGDADPRYFARVVREMAINGYIQSLSKGIRERSTDFRYESFGRLSLPFPLLSEQQAIADFLDVADSRISRYIAAKRRMIALLEEQKQAIINQAVTRGLDPDVPLKPSGVDWLGDIPAHWEVTKMPKLFVFQKGQRAPELTRDYVGKVPGPFPVYSGQTENDGLMATISWYEFDVPSPVIFVTTVGARAMSTRLVRGKFSLSQNCALIRPRSDGVESEFFESVCRRMFEQEKAKISLIMQPSLRFADLRRFFVPVPPIEEQKEISKFIRANITRISSLKGQLQNEHDLIQEYRTRLISDVVTGKLDVRGIELPALDEVVISDLEAVDLVEPSEEFLGIDGEENQ